VQDRDKYYQALVNKVMNIWVLLKMGNLKE
jgi:hypothetical protein